MPTIHRERQTVLDGLSFGLFTAEPSALTLNSASSRDSVSPGSRSRIFRTLMSLCSCLVT